MLNAQGGTGPKLIGAAEPRGEGLRLKHLHTPPARRIWPSRLRDADLRPGRPGGCLQVRKDGRVGAQGRSQTADALPPMSSEERRGVGRRSTLVSLGSLRDHSHARLWWPSLQRAHGVDDGATDVNMDDQVGDNMLTALPTRGPKTAMGASCSCQPRELN